jgi:hypothetical protein
MLVLCDHASDPAFKRIKEVCVNLRDTFSLQTSVRGDWQEVHKNSALYIEAWRYNNLRTHLSSYEYFVRTAIRKLLQTHYELHAHKQLPPEYQAEWDALDTLDGAIRHLPLGSQLRRGVCLHDAQEFTWKVQSSYQQYSESNPLSRSWLLANVPVAARAVENVAKHAAALLQDDGIDTMQHTKLVEECRSAFLKWEKQPKTHLKVPFVVHQARQTGGGVKRKWQDPEQHARLTRMLHELLHAYHY